MIMKFFITLPLLILLGCSQKNLSVQSDEFALQHIVLCWLKDPGNASHRKQIIELSKTFNDIPSVLEARAGQVIRSDRDIVDDSFDVGIVVVVKDENALQEYLDDPIHQKGKTEVLLPLIDKVLVYDFKK
jgi:hypothetical protein